MRCFIVVNSYIPVENLKTTPMTSTNMFFSKNAMYYPIKLIYKIWQVTLIITKELSNGK